MRLSVTQQAGKRCEVDAVRHKVQRLHAWNRYPQEGVDSSGKYPGIDRGYTGWLPVYTDLRFAKSCASTTLQFGGQSIGHAGVPEFVALLSLGNDIKICLLDICRQGKG